MLQRRAPVRTLRHCSTVIVLLTLLGLATSCSGIPSSVDRPSDSQTNLAHPTWDVGAAERAVYRATRTIHGEPRDHDVTILTNTQYQDRRTTVQAEDPDDPDAIPVFKHMVSAAISTDNEEYRFLTIAYVSRRTLQPLKLVSSVHDGHGVSYREFRVRGAQVNAVQFCAYPGTGRSEARYRAGEELEFHDAIPLTFRAYPFETRERPTVIIQRLATQQDYRETQLRPTPAMIEYIGRETISVPFGTVETHRLRMDHGRGDDGRTTVSQYWFAADRAMRNVLVRYEGPFETTYELSHIDWREEREGPR